MMKDLNQENKLTECEGLPILDSEVRKVLQYMKAGKGPVSDNLTSEMNKALEDFGTKKQTNSE